MTDSRESPERSPGNGVERVSEAERERLRSWQRRMIGVFVFTMVYLAAAAAVEILVGMSRPVGTLVFLTLFVLAGLGAALQFSVRCPRCGYRLGRQNSLVVPENCKRCNVSLR
jgi:hypothetical protein